MWHAKGTDVVISSIVREEQPASMPFRIIEMRWGVLQKPTWRDVFGEGALGHSLPPLPHERAAIRPELEFEPIQLRATIGSYCFPLPVAHRDIWRYETP